MLLTHSESDADILEKVGFLDYIDGLLQVDYAFFKHAQFLEAHCHIMISDVCKKLVSF